MSNLTSLWKVWKILSFGAGVFQPADPAVLLSSGEFSFRYPSSLPAEHSITVKAFTEAKSVSKQQDPCKNATLNPKVITKITVYLSYWFRHKVTVWLKGTVLR